MTDEIDSISEKTGCVIFGQLTDKYWKDKLIDD
jgi:hypothetical protein